MKNILTYNVPEILLSKLDKKKYNVLNLDSIDVLLQECCKYELLLFNSESKKTNEKKVFKEIIKKNPEITIVYLIEAGRVRVATKLLKNTIDDYLVKTKEGFEEELIKCVETFDSRVTVQDNEEEVKLAVDLLLTDPRIRKHMELLKKVLETRMSILIEGEKGSDYEMYAKAVHSLSSRKNAVFKSLDCEQLDKEFLSKFIKSGILEECKNGTLFFEDIDCLSIELQNMLSKIFKEMETEEQKDYNIRLVASSKKSLKNEVKIGKFKEELYFKLNGYFIQISPLKDRQDYIPVLVKNFYKFYAKKENKEIDGITNKALKMLENYEWSGDIQEMKNVMYKAVLFNTTGTLNEKDFNSFVRNEKFVNELDKTEFSINLLDGENNLKDLDTIELEVIEKYMKYYDGNISEVSKTLKIGRATLYRKLEESNNG